MKTKKKKIIPLLVLGLIVTSTIGVCTNLNFLNNRKEETINSETITNTNGISIKRITQGKDSSGNPTQTFSYTIEPETSTYQKVNVSLAYKDGSDCSTAMKANVNLENKTITLTCLSDFDMQIILTVTSDFDSDISASATIDYEKKLTSFSFDIDGLNSSLKDEPWSSEYEGNFFFDEYIDETYSKHTINKEFTYQVNINSIESTSPSGSSSILKTIYNLGGNGIEFIQDLRNLMLESFFIDNSFPTANQIWNLTEDENIRKKLLTIRRCK